MHFLLIQRKMLAISLMFITTFQFNLQFKNSLIIAQLCFVDCTTPMSLFYVCVCMCVCVCVYRFLYFMVIMYVKAKIYNFYSTEESFKREGWGEKSDRKYSVIETIIFLLIYYLLLTQIFFW